MYYLCVLRVASNKIKKQNTMKTSIDHLSEDIQNRLEKLVGYILEEVPETQYIILYGSYTGNNYVEYDQRTEFGLRTCYQSDFDIMVLTDKKGASKKSVERRMENASDKYYGRAHFVLRPTLQYEVLFVDEFNKLIKEGRYFWTEVAKKGIALYNSGNYEIEPIRKLDYKQVLKLSKEYYKEKYSKAEGFFDVTQYCYNKQDYRMASFMLHQAVENYCLSISLTSSLYAPKEHNIVKNIKSTTRFTSVVSDVFHANTPEDKRLLNLLKRAYVEGRYNKDFDIAKEDVKALMDRMKKLRVPTKKECLNKIKEHRARAMDSNSESDIDLNALIE